MREIAPTVPGKMRPGVPELDDDAERPERHEAGRSGSGRSACRGSSSRATSRRWSISASGRVQDDALRHRLRAVDLVRGARAASGAIDVDHVLLERLASRRGSTPGGPPARPSRRCGRASRASARSEAAASLTTLRRRSFWMSPPPTLIGVEEPMFVCGAIASDVGGLADPDAGRGGARAGRRDVDDHRDLRRELRLVDLLASTCRGRRACRAGSRPRRSPRRSRGRSAPLT